MASTEYASALGSKGNANLSTWLARSMGIIISLFTENFLSALSIQVDARELLVYVIIIQLVWIAIESTLRSIVASFSVVGLGWRFSNLTIVDLLGQTTLFLTTGMISKVVLSQWTSNSFSVGQITAYGLVLLILFFAFYTKVKIMYVDMLGLIAYFEAIKAPTTASV